MQYHAIPCHTMEYHGTLITADGAYHCPVGSIMAIFIIMRMSLQKRELEISTKRDTVLAWKRRIPYKLFSFHSKLQFSFLFFSPANISVLMFNENIIFFAGYRLILAVKDCSRGRGTRYHQPYD